MGRSPGFGSTSTNLSPSSDSLSLRLRVFPLTSLVNVTRRPVLQKVRHQALTPSDCLWAYGFRFYFTPLPGCFSPFPHGTRALSVAKEYLALEGGPPGFPRDSTCPVVLGVLPESYSRFGYGAFTLSGRTFQSCSPTAFALVEYLQLLLEAPQPLMHNGCSLLHA